MAAFDFPASPVDGQEFTPPGGPTYVFQTPVWLLKAALEPPLTRIASLILTTSGTYAKPVGLKHLQVTVIGGGGGAGQANSTLASQSSAVGGGGGGGTVMHWFNAADLPASIPYTVGAGGAGGNSGGAGGGSTFFGLSAAGGSGSPAGTAGAGSFLHALPGAGGAASGGNILNTYGSTGEYGVRAPHGNPSYAYCGGGGVPLLVPFKPGVYIAGPFSGFAGAIPGAGATGPGNGPNGSTIVGLGGGMGRIYLTEYY